MNRDMKMYLKFLLKREYREHIKNIEQDGTIEKIKDARTSPDKQIMVLLRKNRRVGTFSDYIVFLRMIEYAVEKNYIPIIDRRSIKNDFFPAGDDVNTWEIFFEQPANISLEDISKLDATVYVDYISLKLGPVSLMQCRNKETVDYWRSVARRFIRFNDKTRIYLKEQKRRLIEGKRTLGVSIREGYIKLSLSEPGKVSGHPRQLEIHDLVRHVEKYIVEWNCSHVFFTCQTLDTERLFKERFGDKAICVDRKRKSYKDLPEGKEVRTRTAEDAYENELGYITEIFLLSCCTSFLCSGNSGSEAAFIMSEGYENFKCIELGTY